jgi:hypothetical protein
MCHCIPILLVETLATDSYFVIFIYGTLILYWRTYEFSYSVLSGQIIIYKILCKK